MSRLTISILYLMTRDINVNNDQIELILSPAHPSELKPIKKSLTTNDFYNDVNNKFFQLKFDSKIQNNRLELLKEKYKVE